MVGALALAGCGDSGDDTRGSDSDVSVGSSSSDNDSDSDSDDPSDGDSSVGSTLSNASQLIRTRSATFAPTHHLLFTQSHNVISSSRVSSAWPFHGSTVSMHHSTIVISASRPTICNAPKKPSCGGAPGIPNKL